MAMGFFQVYFRSLICWPILCAKRRHFSTQQKSIDVEMFFVVVVLVVVVVLFSKIKGNGKKVVACPFKLKHRFSS